MKGEIISLRNGLDNVKKQLDGNAMEKSLVEM